MKKVMISFLALTLLTPALSSAHHVDWKPPHGWHQGGGWKTAAALASQLETR
ncbi:hypothetical protein BN437_1684 [Erwinia amylovora NBRC 12687 = CFBP 1232]|uniref:Uncharacterized protein n=1 Tax=Erwinia amylovora NBRC 12687 = CFBP 1232 TaxID=1219359 RepID=A0A831EQL8_ERWAM|nr:hypothetical protein BN437_1684 [Erwinia amylovora NBRC 12687 = CFBP 1232]